VNCAALPGALLESELFGHEKGAFTGAYRQKPGKFEAADGGTLMLDEIGEMPLRLQAKLLHVLQDGEFSRVGGEKIIDTDVRLIACTNRDLESAMRAHQFREDLYYRLNVIEIRIPPLRERREEIPLLIRGFLDELAVREGRTVLLAEDATEYLTSLPWLGNIRELKHKIESIFLCAGKQELVDRTTLLKLLHPGGAPIAEMPSARGLRRKVDMLKREEVLAALSRNGGNRSRAALELGITRRHLIRLLKQIY
jgi:transcriptional regulator with GAF, ATPase, and Fis domain